MKKNGKFFLNKKTLNQGKTEDSRKRYSKIIKEEEDEIKKHNSQDEDIDRIGNYSYQSDNEEDDDQSISNHSKNFDESSSEEEKSEEEKEDKFYLKNSNNQTKNKNNNINKNKNNNVNELSLEETNNVKKGKSISNQKKLFDMIIGLRISLQKIFKSSNLISYKNYAKYISEIFEKKEERKIKIAIHSMKSYYDLLLSIMELIEALCSKGNLYSQKNLDISSMKLIINQLENEMEKFDSFKPGKQIQNEGKNNNNKDFNNESYLKFLEKSLLNTYENFQIIYENLSKLYYAVFNIWHKKTLAYDNNKNNKFGENLSLMNFSENISKYLDLNFKKILLKYREEREDNNNTFNNSHNQDFCYNYKDDEFYNNLLKEILSQKDLNSIEDTYSANNRFDYTYNYLLNKSQKTKTKIVDTKASKNRKIRYETHEKIINFMVPIENLNSHIGRDAFIRSIFGLNSKKSNNEYNENNGFDDEENDIDII
jgi:protein AATF/BFR2